TGLGIGYVGAEPGAARWTAALDRLAAVVGPDAEEFKRVTAALRRPQLLVLCAGRPGDEGQWKAAHEALTDRARNRYAPDIVACGTADTPAGLLIELTGRPETAFVAYEDDVTAAIDEFFHFALRRTQDLARAVLDGDTTAVLVPPAGYRPATELLDR
ncbi:MAG: hypothetical protein HOV83_32980, partial [Catenulispora sp.]|nr:hypothetical protein [Catenulispora sp.]